LNPVETFKQAMDGGLARYNEQVTNQMRVLAQWRQDLKRQRSDFDEQVQRLNALAAELRAHCGMDVPDVEPKLPTGEPPGPIRMWVGDQWVALHWTADGRLGYQPPSAITGVRD
jgi:hypothetical protein